MVGCHLQVEQTQKMELSNTFEKAGKPKIMFNKDLLRLKEQFDEETLSLIEFRSLEQLCGIMSTYKGHAAQVQQENLKKYINFLLTFFQGETKSLNVQKQLYLQPVISYLSVSKGFWTSGWIPLFAVPGFLIDFILLILGVLEYLFFIPWFTLILTCYGYAYILKKKRQGKYLIR
ncbi:hypothetical protein C7460_1022 [Marinoscillum furvescens DSM 4134]|uniref:Uncharacterized protein n=2 Tax=Marinoscillum furvescens TaxID=1026 RepID=A0A3D9L8I5_MARFU|nr:hypothetical protein C7460_1022 [Marinoscillum furvescens DSM 4134]